MGITCGLELLEGNRYIPIIAFMVSARLLNLLKVQSENHIVGIL